MSASGHALLFVKAVSGSACAKTGTHCAVASAVKALVQRKNQTTFKVFQTQEFSVTNLHQLGDAKIEAAALSAAAAMLTIWTDIRRL